MFRWHFGFSAYTAEKYHATGKIRNQPMIFHRRAHTELSINDEFKNNCDCDNTINIANNSKISRRAQFRTTRTHTFTMRQHQRLFSSVRTVTSSEKHHAFVVL